MLRNIHKFFTSIAMLAVICVSSNIVLAQTNLAEITVTGSVTVNGNKAVSASTITSGSRIVTGADSRAIVNLGTRGKLEVFPSSAATLKFTDYNFVILLHDGKVRVMNTAGTGATVTTPSATVVADTGRANSFIVSLGCGDEDEKCRETFVETFEGFVTMTTNNDQTLKQIPAGTRASSGDSCSKACLKPALLPVATSGAGIPLIALLLGGIGAGVITAILVGGGGPDPGPQPPTVVVSPNS